MSGRLSDYEFELAPELIALRPAPRRQDARMMILRRASETIEHGAFADLPQILTPNDLLVLNDSRVLAARHLSDDGRFEFLFLEQLGPRRWKALVKPGRKFREGTSIRQVSAQPGRRFADGSREVVLEHELDLHRLGSMPLPPYLGRAPEPDDDTRYQTVFARHDGSLAAPTAGLHFSEEMLAALPHITVTLHVGTGTFRPVKCKEIARHEMHSEPYEISPAAVAAIRAAGRIVAVGTTSVRVLESVVREKGAIVAGEGRTNIFIYPPFQFRAVDALLTNFHLPRSTLLMLVSAFAGREFILRSYQEAVRARYRFFSYGDCMLIL